MRIAPLIAASALVAACSTTTDGIAEGGRYTALTPIPSAIPSPTTSTSATTGTTRPSSAPPAAHAAIADVIAWIEAGSPADAAAFHTATRDGTATDLGADVAFTTRDANCMTDRRADGALACLVDLADPPAQPAEVYGGWKGNWVDFEGPTAEVGSVHSDPGRFGNGTGPVLGAGTSLAFGDYRCRADTAVVYCVNYAHRSALEFGRDGIDAFGCLQQVAPPGDVGVKFSC